MAKFLVGLMLLRSICRAAQTSPPIPSTQTSKISLLFRESGSQCADFIPHYLNADTE